MPRKTHDDLLTELTKKQEAIQNRIASIQARKRKEEDRILTRKKILIGAYILETCQTEEQLSQFIKKMDPFLTRPHDRKLFGLAVTE